MIILRPAFLPLITASTMLAGCDAFDENRDTTPLFAECENGAVMSQASFGGPLRCVPQSEELTLRPASN